MAITLKLVEKADDDKIVQELILVNDDNDSAVPLEEANRKGILLKESTFSRLQTLVILGQRYEAISKSQKSEFSDI